MKVRNKIFVFIGLSMGALALLFYKKSLVILMIIGGYFIAPEASQILRHYCFGDGSDIYLNPDYIKESPVVLKQIKTLKIGESRWVTLKQKEDWRLSYALNPFTITRLKNGYRIHQYMQFDKSGNVNTYLKVGFIKLKMRDNIVHTFDCTPFTVICEWED
jgi:hypothetical protein